MLTPLEIVQTHSMVICSSYVEKWKKIVKFIPVHMAFKHFTNLMSNNGHKFMPLYH